MSCMLTEAAVRDRRKTVTRRKGWRFLRAGDRVRLCRKCMGLRAGEKVEALAVVRILSVRRELLSAIDAEDVVREGFEGMTPAEFVAMFCRHMGGEPDQEVTRIEWVYVDE